MSERALELAYRYLSRRERTVAELHRHLLARDVDEAAAATAIEELLEQGYLDDARFARLFVQDKQTLEQWGSQRIRRGLKARGIDPELVETVLAENEMAAGARGEGAEAACAEGEGGEGHDGGCHDGELERALGLLRRRFPEPPRTRRERERALGLLLRKGYEPDLALDALRGHREGARAVIALTAARYYDPVSERKGLRAEEKPANMQISDPETSVDGN